MATAKKKFFARLWQGVVNAWNWLTGNTKIMVPKVVDIVNKIKEADDNGLLDILTLVIPGDKDDKLVLKYREVFRQVILALGSVQEISDLPTDEEKIAAIIAKIKGSHPNAQTAFWTSLATKVVEIMSDGKISWGEALVLVKYVYDNLDQIKKQNEGSDRIDNDGDGNIDEEDEG